MNTSQKQMYHLELPRVWLWLSDKEALPFFKYIDQDLFQTYNEDASVPFYLFTAPHNDESNG